ncbi:tudor domain-containing protein [Ditylenchus destructor]|nr:tudor domain-containing protein [Ditylenchus destructor]
MIIPPTTSQTTSASIPTGSSSISEAIAPSNQIPKSVTNSLVNPFSNFPSLTNKKLLTFIAAVGGLSAACAAFWIIQKHFYRKKNPSLPSSSRETMAGEHSKTSGTSNKPNEEDPLISCSFERKLQINSNESSGLTNGYATKFDDVTLRNHSDTSNDQNRKPDSLTQSQGDLFSASRLSTNYDLNQTGQTQLQSSPSSQTSSISSVVSPTTENDNESPSAQHLSQGNVESMGLQQKPRVAINLHQYSSQEQENYENTPANNSNGYKNAESPNSTNSEGSTDSGSQDSGRATGGLTSTSPFDINDMSANGIMGPLPSQEYAIALYEFEIPNTLVGLIIGVGGKTIKELCKRAEVKMLIRPHHNTFKQDTHQICSVEGKRENINKCLHMIKGRFPKERFPDLNLKPVLPPPPPPATMMPSNPMVATQLPMPMGAPCEVYVSASVDSGHFFVQLPTHPSFPSLQLLDQYMLNVYNQASGVPDLPKPCNVGVLCVAPAYNAWFRALTLDYYSEQDEVLVRYVDYGGFARVPRADLRQIRSDFLRLPLQAIECYLANVQPVDGTSRWSEEANELFQKLCAAKIIQAELVGHDKNNGTPCVILFIVDEKKKVIRIDQELLERGLAKPADPTRITPLCTKQMSNSSATNVLKERRGSLIPKENGLAQVA